MGNLCCADDATIDQPLIASRPLPVYKDFDFAEFLTHFETSEQQYFEAYLQNKEDPNYCFEGEMTLLMAYFYISKTHSPAVVAAITAQKGFDVNTLSQSGTTALHILVDRRSPSLQIIQDLVAEGADVNLKGAKAVSVLEQYLKMNDPLDPITVKYLLRIGADPSQLSAPHQTAIKDLLAEL